VEIELRAYILVRVPSSYPNVLGPDHVSTSTNPTTSVSDATTCPPYPLCTVPHSNQSLNQSQRPGPRTAQKMRMQRNACNAQTCITSCLQCKPMQRHMLTCMHGCTPAGASRAVRSSFGASEGLVDYAPDTDECYTITRTTERPHQSKAPVGAAPPQGATSGSNGKWKLMPKSEWLPPAHRQSTGKPSSLTPCSV
jgi:hypothetical protein